MKKIRCMIVDDEPVARRGMRRLIDMHPDLEEVGWASCAADAWKFLSENDVDLVFLDIDMPGESGMELARRIERHPMVVFTTAYSDYALDSYEVEALDYLLKPMRPERFNRAVARAIERLRSVSAGPDSRQERIITIKADRRFERISLDSILYIEGLGDYLLIHLSDRRLTTRMTFKALLSKLPSQEFIRVNKSYAVNRRKITSYSSTTLRVADTDIPVGGLYREEVRRRLEN